MFPELDDDEDEEKQPEEANSKPLEDSAPPTPKKQNEQAPLSPKHKEDDGFLLTPKKQNEEAPSSPKHKEDDGFLDSLFDVPFHARAPMIHKFLHILNVLVQCFCPKHH